MKLKSEHVGNFVRVYYTKDYGCMDAVLIDVVDDIAEVYFIGLKLKETIATSDIVAIGPALTASVPRF